MKKISAPPVSIKITGPAERVSSSSAFTAGSSVRYRTVTIPAPVAFRKMASPIWVVLPSTVCPFGSKKV